MTKPVTTPKVRPLFIDLIAAADKAAADKSVDLKAEIDRVFIKHGHFPEIEEKGHEVTKNAAANWLDEVVKKHR